VQVVQAARLETTTVRLAAIHPHLVLHQQAVGLEVETPLLAERAEAAAATAVAAMLRLRLAQQAKATPAVGATQANRVSCMAAVAAVRLRLAQIGTQAAPRATAAREVRCLELPTRAAVAAEMSAPAHRSPKAEVVAAVAADIPMLVHATAFLAQPILAAVAVVEATTEQPAEAVELEQMESS
jgi:hypothetical protein